MLGVKRILPILGAEIGEGITVEAVKGDKIGVVGNTGVMETNVTGVHAAMSVGDTFVSFYPLCTEAEDSGDGGIYMYGVLEPPKDENAK